MVCRMSRFSSAMTTFARDMSGLEDNQVLGLNHALIQEGASCPAPSQEEWTNLINRMETEFQAGRLRIRSGSHSPEARFQAAREETADRRYFYAASRIVERAQRARDAQTEFFNRYARDLGVNPAHASVDFWTRFNEASENSRLCASPAFSRRWLADPDNSGLPVDRRSLYAFEQMEASRATRAAQGDRRVAVVRQDVESSFIREMGYDPINGRLELVMNSAPTRVYAYRLSPAEYEEFVNSPSMGSHFARNIRNNPDYQYASVEEAEAAGFHVRCATCGQFTGSSHSCPITGSEEDLNRDIRLAVERTRAAANNQPLPTSLPRAERMPLTRTLRYVFDHGSLRIPGATRVTQEARRHDQILVPVRAAMNTTGQASASVSGYVHVEYNGRGQGYTISPVTEPGDSGTDNLRCSCPTYQATYTCEHIRQVVDQVSSQLNGDTVRATANSVSTGAARVREQLTGQYQESVTSTELAAASFVPLSTDHLMDDTVFQDIYAEARQARQAYKDAIAAGTNPDEVEYPVPYIRENAFNGLAKRGSGRGFGVEIEFSFPPGTTDEQRSTAIAAIGQELYETGLTDGRNQKGYGASHGRYTDNHARGWSFEADMSTGVLPGYGHSDEAVNGGELVSPVMFDEPATWENLEKVTKIMRKHGAIASNRAGMHVHVGVGDYDHRIENHNRLVAAYAENEDLLYRLSTDPERNRHRGQAYCEPNEMPAGPYTTIGAARAEQTGHHLALNLQSVAGRTKDHVEFRTFDATLQPAVMQAQIATAVYMAEGATREGTASLSNLRANPLGSRLEANPSRNALTGEEWKASTAGVRNFLNKFVPGDGGNDKDNPRVRQIVSLFAMTKWQRNRSPRWD